MSLFDVTSSALEVAIKGTEQRQGVLANNLANANTPQFKRSDLDFHSTLAGALAAGDSTTQLDSVTFAPQTDTTTSMQADGNNVDVDTEMSNLSANALDYQSLIAVASARLKMLQTAIGTGQ